MRIVAYQLKLDLQCRPWCLAVPSLDSSAVSLLEKGLHAQAASCI